MSDTSFLDWPFFESRHRELAAALEAWCAANLPVPHGDVDAACKGLVSTLGAGGWLKHSGAGEGERLDVRSLCLIRETLACAISGCEDDAVAACGEVGCEAAADGAGGAGDEDCLLCLVVWHRSNIT